MLTRFIYARDNSYRFCQGYPAEPPPRAYALSRARFPPLLSRRQDLRFPKFVSPAHNCLVESLRGRKTMRRRKRSFRVARTSRRLSRRSARAYKLNFVRAEHGHLSCQILNPPSDL